jgi:hypothetical protein
MQKIDPRNPEVEKRIQEALADYKFERQHSQEFFYKYTSAETAKKVLTSSKFRYSSPLIFNDPFDNHAGMHIDFDIGDFVNLFFNRLEEIVLAPEDPVFEDYNDYSKATMMMRAMRETHGFPKTRAIETMGPIVQSIADKMKETHEELTKSWERDIARMRMFCVSEEFDNIQMWSHYADYHKGVVIKLKVAETAAEDDPLWLARRVNYIPKALPLFGHARVDEILGIRKFEFNSLYDMFAYSKFDIWHSEKEWRFFNLENEPDELYYSDYEFRFDKIDTIIFGCRCPEDDIAEIKRIALHKKNDIVFLKAIQHPYEYKLNFIQA